MSESYTRSDLERLGELVQQAKALAKEYRSLTGKPLGITGEIAEYEAARILGLQLCKARQAGYDAFRIRDGVVRKVQIKGRCIVEDRPGQRLGRLEPRHEWDIVLLVLLDADFEPMRIYEAERSVLLEALEAPGSKARNERGQLGVRKFQSLGRLVWERSGPERSA